MQGDQQRHPNYAQQPYPYPAPLVRPTSTLAVTGFVASLLWGLGFLSVLGLILSLVAMKETGKGIKGGHGFAVAGVILGALGTVGLILFGLPILVGIFEVALNPPA